MGIFKPSDVLRAGIDIPREQFDRLPNRYALDWSTCPRGPDDTKAWVDAELQRQAEVEEQQALRDRYLDRRALEDPAVLPYSGPLGTPASAAQLASSLRNLQHPPDLQTRFQERFDAIRAASRTPEALAEKRIAQLEAENAVLRQALERAERNVAEFKERRYRPGFVDL